MRVGLYNEISKERVFRNDYDYADIETLFEVDEIELGKVYYHSGKYYSPSMISRDSNFAAVTEILIDKDNTTCDYENRITCPFCGNADNDSLECGDSDNDYECGHCGAILSFERDVEVTYSTQLIKQPEIVKVEQAI